MNRDDLRVWTCQDMYDSPQHEVDCSRPVTDAELAELGLVALDGIDVEALRGHIEATERLAIENDWHPDTLLTPIHLAAKTVLAAIDGEDTE